MNESEHIIRAIESIRHHLPDAVAFDVTAHPMLAKRLYRQHVAAACREAGYEITLTFSQGVGSVDKLVVEPKQQPAAVRVGHVSSWSKPYKPPVPTVSQVLREWPGLAVLKG